MRNLFGVVVSAFRRSWKQLAVTDIIYKVAAFVLLAPLMAILFRILIAVSGSAVLTDQDILFFFLGPAGWLCMVVIGGLWIGIVSLELAASMAILASADGERIGVLDALRFAAVNSWRVFRVTARMVAITVLTTAPFLAALTVVYLSLLTEFDINYYLKERPPVFLLSLGIGAIIVVTLAVVLLRLFTGWFFALPLVLFEGVSPSVALRVSRDRATGHRRALLIWIVGWSLAMMLLSALATSAVIWLGAWIVPSTAHSLGLLTVVIGSFLLLWGLLNLALHLLATTSLAAICFTLYRRLGRDPTAAPLQPSPVQTTQGDIGLRITWKRLLVASIVGMVVSGAVGFAVLRSTRLDDRVFVIAHRGASGTAPENTLAAVKQAIEDRADWIEIDVQETADGEVVVFHDSDFKRTAGRDLKIWDATSADLRNLDVGSWFDARFKDERVPTLGQVLEACRGKAGVMIELKYYGHDEKLEERVAAIVDAHEMASEIVIISLNADAIKKMKALRPSWRTGQLLSVAAGDLRKINADFLAMNAASIDRRLLRSVHANGKEVYAWTVNEPLSMSTMIGRGVDGLITDHPARARSVLEYRAGLSPPERLLLELAGTFGVTPSIGEEQ